MKTIYRCTECGEDYKPESPTAKISNIGTVDELVYHLDLCTCQDHKENEALDQLHEAQQEVKRLRSELETIIDSAGCCTGEDAQNMLEIAQWALKGGTPDAKE